MMCITDHALAGTVLAVICLVLSFGHHCSGDGQTNGFLSFSTTSITVQETARQIPVTINRSGGTKGLLVFKVEVQNFTMLLDVDLFIGLYVWSSVLVVCLDSANNFTRLSVNI